MAARLPPDPDIGNEGVNEPGPVYAWTAQPFKYRFGFGFALLGVARLAKKHFDSSIIASGFGVVGAAAILHTAYVKAITWMNHQGSYFTIFKLIDRMSLWMLKDDELFCIDGAPEDIQEKRRAGFENILQKWKERQPAELASIKAKMSDLRFGDTVRVPFFFRKAINGRLSYGTMSSETRGNTIICQSTGETLFDMCNGYGCNLAGHDRAKNFFANAAKTIEKVSPCAMGPVIPQTEYVCSRILEHTGMDQVSFHMSGTEACMAACSMVRFNTQRRLILVFTQCFHGWWDGLLLGGNGRPPTDLLICPIGPSATSLIKARASEIAAVFLTVFYDDNVVELHGGAAPLSASKDSAGLEDETEKKLAAYTILVKEVRKQCTENKVPFVIDDVLNGFRLGSTGTQGFFGVKPDMTILGKAIGNGVPVGVVAGKKWLMAKLDPEKPLRMCFVAGTYAAAPLTIAMLHESLKFYESEEYLTAHAENERMSRDFAVKLNQQFKADELPLCVRTISSMISLIYTQPSRYNWIYGYYMMAEGIEMHFFGFRILTNLGWTQADFDEFRARIVSSAKKCKDDQWWWSDGKTDQGEKLKNEFFSRYLFKRKKKEVANGHKEA